MSRLVALDSGLLLLIQEYLRADWMNGFWRAISGLGNLGLFWILLSLILLLFRSTRRAGAAARSTAPSRPAAPGAPTPTAGEVRGSAD